MTQQSAVLLIAFLAGLVVAAVLLGTARRNVLPRSAMVIAALAIPIWVVYFASSQGRSLLASKGFLSTMPEALWFGLTFGVFTAAFFLALGYSSFILCSEGLSLGLAVPVASLFEGEKHSAHTADARRVPVSDASQLTIAQSEVKKVVITLHRTKRRTV